MKMGSKKWVGGTGVLGQKLLGCCGYEWALEE